MSVFPFSCPDSRQFSVFYLHFSTVNIEASSVEWHSTELKWHFFEIKCHFTIVKCHSSSGMFLYEKFRAVRLKDAESVYAR